MSDYPVQDDLNDEDIISDEEDPGAEDRYYSDDVQAEADAEFNPGMNPSEFHERKEDPVTTGDMQIGDLDVVDRGDDAGRGGEDSYDEENMPGGDNVSD